MKLLTYAAIVRFSSSWARLSGQAHAELVNREGSVIGKVLLEETWNSGMLIYVEVENLPPGPHGIPLHALAVCSPDFKAATDHINPEGRKHGLCNADGPDDGDLPNLYAEATAPPKPSSSPLASMSRGCWRRTDRR